MKTKRTAWITTATFLTTVAFAGVVHAVVTQFNDIALDGNGSNPFIRFEATGVSDRFFVAFSDNLAMWDGSTYSFRLFDSAASNNLVVKDSKVGILTPDPSEALHVNGNAFISGNLELGSSRTIKSDITALTSAEAQATIAQLEPVTFKYLHSQDELSVGFIAEDVPDLVATKNRNSLSSMDMVAVLTKVVQEQQQSIEHLSNQVAQLCDSRGC